jgi:GTPase KRas protein
MFVVGNKCDLESDREVPKHKAENDYSVQWGIDVWEVSAKNGNNINTIFLDLATSICFVYLEMI